jgi:hypothetical protein
MTILLVFDGNRIDRMVKTRKTEPGGSPFRPFTLFPARTRNGPIAVTPVNVTSINGANTEKRLFVVFLSK